MGRIIELPCGAAGALLGVILLQRLPAHLTFFVYMVMLMLALALMYQAMLVWHRHGNRPVILATVEGERWNGSSFETENGLSESDVSDIFTLNESALVGENSRMNTSAVTTAPVKESSPVAEISQPELSPVFNMTPEQLEKQLRIFKRFYRLTRRETEVLQELIWERSIQEISERLNISQRTVKYHISNLFQKTDVKTQKELKRTLRKQKRRFEKGLDPLPPDEYEEDE